MPPDALRAPTLAICECRAERGWSRRPLCVPTRASAGGEAVAATRSGLQNSLGHPRRAARSIVDAPVSPLSFDRRSVFRPSVSPPLRSSPTPHEIGPVRRAFDRAVALGRSVAGPRRESVETTVVRGTIGNGDSRATRARQTTQVAMGKSRGTDVFAPILAATRYMFCDDKCVWRGMPAAAVCK